MTERIAQIAPSEPAVELVGAVALMDALGFKNFRKRKAAVQVLRTLEAVKKAYVDRAAMHEEILGQLQSSGDVLDWGPTYRAFFMSDTIAFTAGAPQAQASEGSSGHLLGDLVSGIARACRLAVDPGHGLLYRGAIAYGEIAISNDFAVGAAVDDAAALMESADAAVVWLAPSALRLLEPGSVSAAIFTANFSGSLLDWEVPMRDGKTFRTKAVNPFRGNPDFHDEHLRFAMLETFRGANDLGVAVKEQNTRAFLDEALKCERALRREEALARSALDSPDSEQSPTGGHEPDVTP